MLFRSYLRQNIDIKRKSTLVIMTYKSETSKYLDDITGEVYQLCNVNDKTLITNACQQNNTIITEKIVSNRNCQEQLFTFSQFKVLNQLFFAVRREPCQPYCKVTRSL